MELANHGLILLQQLNAQREFGFLCDCTVAIGDVFFKAHKAVLAAFSNYFRMLFIHQDRYGHGHVLHIIAAGTHLGNNPHFFTSVLEYTNTVVAPRTRSCSVHIRVWGQEDDS